MGEVYTKEVSFNIFPSQTTVCAGTILEKLRTFDGVLVATKVGNFPLKRVAAVVFTVNEASFVVCTCLAVGNTLEIMVVFTAV